MKWTKLDPYNFDTLFNGTCGRITEITLDDLSDLDVVNITQDFLKTEGRIYMDNNRFYMIGYITPPSDKFVGRTKMIINVCQIMEN